MAPTPLRAPLAIAHTLRRRTRSVAALVALAIAGLSCGERITAPQGQRSVAFAVAPTYTPRAALIEDALATFGLTVDTIRIRLTRAGGEVALDTLIAFPAAVDSVAITLRLQISGSSEAFTALIELRQGSTVLFSGTQGVTLRVNPPTGGNAPEISVEYVGPGAEAETIVVAPADTTVQPGATFQMRAAALDAQNDTVAATPIDWRSLDPTIGTIDASGTFSAVATRGVARIAVKIPNLVEDTALVRIVPPATHLAVISGGGQTGAAGAALAAPIVVQVQAADNLPVPGVTVNFAVDAGGGGVAPPSAVGDTLGRVSATFTLGTGVGVQSIRATSAGLPDLVISATSEAAAATQIVILDEPQDTATVGVALDVAPRVELRDTFGNPRLVAGVNVTVALSAPAVGSIAGTTTVATDANGQATFNGLQLNALIGPVTLTFTSGALPPAVSDTAILVQGPAALLTVEGGTGFVAPAGDSIPLVHAVRVTDAGANPIDSFPLLLDMPDSPDTTVHTDATGRFHLRSLPPPEVVGVYPLIFSGTGLTGPVTITVTVVAGTPKSLAFSQLPSDTAVIGNALLQQPRVQLKDAFGNSVAQAGVAIEAEIVGAGRSLSGTAIVATNAAGTAIFTNLAIVGADGSAQLRFVATGLDTLVSDTITLFPALASELKFTLEPSSPMANTPFNVIVTAQDGFGNADVGFTGNVAVALGTNPSGSTLSGTLVQAAVNGVATFNNLSLNNTGTGHTLVATSPGLAPDTTAAFEVITGVTYHDERRPGDIAIYKNVAAWFGENKDETVLQGNPFKLAPALGDYTVHPMADLLSGIPASTSIVILTSASDGDAAGQIDEQQAGFANLDTWVRNGGWLVAHAGDNYAPDGYQVPGLSGIVDADTACTGLTPAIADHAFIRGPDALLGTADDIVPFIMGVCSDNHGSLEGILPGNAVVLLRETGDLQRPVYATYTLGAGRVIVTTQSIEFVSHSTQALINHFYWAINGVNAGPAQPVVRTANWLGGTGLWSDPAKWDLGLVPAEDDSVFIAGTGVDTVFVNQPVTVSQLYVGGASGTQVLDFQSSWTLTVTDELVVAPMTGRVNLQSGTLAGTGDVTVHGSMETLNGTISTSGLLTVSATGTVAMLGGLTRSNGNTNIVGSVDLDGSLAVGGGAIVTIDAAGQLLISGSGPAFTTASGGGTFVNNGLIDKITDIGQATISAPFINNGALQVTTGSVRIDPSGTYSHSGSFNAATGTTLQFANGTNTLAGAVTGDGTLHLANGSLSLDGGASVSHLWQNSGTLNVNAALSVADSLKQLAGTLTLSSGGTVSVPFVLQQSGTLTGSDTVVVLDSLHWIGGTMSGASALRVADTAVAVLTNGGFTKTLNSRRLELAGHLLWSGGTFQLTSSEVLVLPTGDFEMTDDVGTGNSSAIGITNQGLVRKSGGVGFANINTPFTNNGIVRAEVGRLRVATSSSVSHNGDFEAMTPTAGFEFTAGVNTLNGPVRGGGTLFVQTGTVIANDSLILNGLTVASGTLNVLGRTIITDSLRQSSGVLALDGLQTVSVPRAEFTGGTLQGADTLTVTDSLLWSGGTMTGTGTTHLNAGAFALLGTTTGRSLAGGRRFSMAGSALWNNGSFSVANGSVVDVLPGGEFLIDGSLTLTNGTGNGVLANAGRVARVAGTGIAIISTQYSNTGQLDVLSGTLRYNNTGGPFTTSGPVNVSAGAILEMASGTHVVNSAVSGAGTFQQGSGTLTLGASPTVPVFLLGNGTLNLASGGVISIPTFVQFNGTLQGADTLLVTDSLNWQSGTQTGAGVTIVDSTATAAFQLTSGRTLSGGRTFALRGYGVHDGGTWSLGGGSTMLVDSTGTYEIRGDVGFTTTTGGGTVVNTGTIVKTVGTGLSSFIAPFVNDGDVAVLTGTVRASTSTGSYTHGGSWAATAPGIIDFAGGATHTVNGGVFGTGTLQLSGSAAVVNVAAPMNVETVNVTTGTLTFNSGSAISVPRLLLSSGTIQGADTLFVTDSMHWTAGTLNGSGVTYVHDTASLVLATTGSRSILGGRTLRVEGDLFAQAGSLSFGGGSSLFLGAGGVAEFQGAVAFNVTTGSGTFTNTGTVRRNGAVGTTTLTVPFTNSGSVDITVGTFALNGAGAFTHSGSVAVTAPAVFSVTAGTHNFAGGLVGTGTLFNTATTTASAFSDLPVLVVGGGTLTFAGGVSEVDTVRVTGGVLDFSSGEQIAVPSVIFTGGTIQGIDTLIVLDTLDWATGVFSGTGRTVVLDTAATNFSTTGTKSLSAGRQFILEGLMRWQGGSVTLSGGSLLEIADSGSVVLTANASLNTAAGSGTVINNGSFQRTGGTGAFTISAPFTNNGAFATSTGTTALTSTAGHTHGGSWTVTAPASLEFAGGVQTVNGTVTGTGFGRFSGTAVTLNQAYGLPSMLVIGGSTTVLGPIGPLDSLRFTGGALALNSGAPVSTNRLFLASGTLQGADTVVVLDSADWTSGTMSGTGATQIVDGAMLTVSSTSTKVLSGGRVLDLDGDARWSAGTWQLGNGSEVHVTGLGDLEVTGNVVMSPTTGGGRLLNEGSIRRTAGTAAFSVSTRFHNHGVVETFTGNNFFTSPDTVTHTGRWHPQGSTMLTVGGHTQTFDGPFVGSGRVTISGTVTTVNDTMDVGTILMANGTATINGPVLPLDSLQINGGVSIAFATGTPVQTAVYLQVAGIRLGADTIVALDSLVWTGGTMGGAGVTMTTDTTVGIINGGGTKTLADSHVLEISGATTWSVGGIALANASQLRTTPTGTLSIAFSTSVTGTGAFSNAGLLQKVTNTGTASIATAFTNTGHVTSSAGTLDLTATTGSFTHTGTWEPIGAGTIRLSGATHQLDSTVIGTGHFAVAGGTVTLNDDFDVPSLLYSAGAFTVNSPVFNVADSLRSTATTNLVLNTAAVVPSGGVWSLRGTGGITGTGSIANLGTFQKSAGGSGAIVSVPFDNAGLLSSTANGLSFTRAFAHQASAIARGSSTLTFNADSVTAWDGALTPGSATTRDQLSVAGAIVTSSTSSINIRIGGTALSNYDRLVMLNQATLTGTLNVTLFNSYVPVSGNSWTIVSYPAGTPTPTFSQINLPPEILPGWVLIGPTSITITVP